MRLDLLADRSQPLRAHDPVAPKHRVGFVPKDRHGVHLRHAGVDQVGRRAGP
jgi:hypothetical protein